MGSKAAYRTFQPSMCLISKLNVSCTTMSLKGRFTHENKHYNCSEWLCTFVSSYNSFSGVLWPQHRAKNNRLACRPGIELFDLKEQFACWHMLNIAQMEIINIDNKPVPCACPLLGPWLHMGGMKNETHVPRERYGYTHAFRVRCVSLLLSRPIRLSAFSRLALFKMM